MQLINKYKILWREFKKWMKNSKILLSNIYEKLNDSCADLSALILTTFFIFHNGVIFMLDNDIYCTIVSRIYVLVLCLYARHGSPIYA